MGIPRRNSGMTALQQDDLTRRHRWVMATGATSFLCFTFSALYLFRFPTIGTPLESDLLFVTVVAVWIGSLLAGSLVATQGKDVAILLLSIYFLALLARIALSVRSYVLVLADPYFFGVA